MAAGGFVLIERSRWTNAEAPAGCRIHAVGDIHGRADLLDRLIGAISRDLDDHPPARAILVFLGDYIDRGPDSKAVVERLTGTAPTHFEMHFLKGNHEDLLLDFLSDPLSGAAWLRNGGDATMLSYGVDPDLVEGAARLSPSALIEAAEALDDKLPEAHLAFYRRLRLWLRAGDYFFAHAGVRPGTALGRQSEQDLLWIREEFLDYPFAFGAVVVHGHTPELPPRDLENRIGIDTMAWRTGCLTAAVLEGRERRFLRTPVT